MQRPDFNALPSNLRVPLHPGILAALLAISLTFGCSPASAPTPDSPPPPTPTPTPASNQPPAHLDHAQPRLKTITLYIGPHEVQAELALTRTQIATGMMFRKDMKEEEGMLFVFPRPHQTGFYMKNTTVPLSAAYIDREGNILEIHPLEPLNEKPVIADTDQVQFVLEMNQGWFARHNITEGAFIRTERGTLPETFFSGRLIAP